MGSVVAEREITFLVGLLCVWMSIVRVLFVYVNLIRTLAYSQEKYEFYINARNSRVLYSNFASFSHSLWFIFIAFRLSCTYLIAFRLLDQFLLPSGSSLAFRLISYSSGSTIAINCKRIQLASCSITTTNIGPVLNVPRGEKIWVFAVVFGSRKF